MEEETYSINKIQFPNILRINSIADLKIEKPVPKPKTFCEVKYCKFDEQYYALKIIHKEQIESSKFKCEYLRLFNEITILYRLNHKNIIRLYWHCEDSTQIYLLLQYGGMRLRSLIKKKKLQENQAKDFLRQIVKGIKQIHDAGYIHRDLTIDNILVNRDKEIKIIDFGFANEIVTVRTTQIGSFEYMAPEMFKMDSYNYKVDIWSLGIIAYVMVHGQAPFYSSDKPFRDTIYTNNRDKLKYQISNELSYQYASFIQRLLVLNPQNRPSIDEVYSLSFLCLEEQEQQFQIFNQQNTQKIERKTRLYQQAKQIKQQMNFSGVNRQKFEKEEKSIYELEKQLKQTISKSFISLYNQKNVIKELLKTQKLIIQRNIMIIDQDEIFLKQSRKF